MSSTTTLDQDERRRRTVRWVVVIATLGMVFDGYDLVIYGAVLSTFLGDPNQIGEVTPTLAGTLGSYALLGMMAGALLAGAVGDRIGRRTVMLVAYAWFSVGMFVTALMTTTTSFGVLRFLTGLGIGALIGTTATLVTEMAPPGKKNLASAISYAGVPMGSLLGALLAMLLLEAVGWRALFMADCLGVGMVGINTTIKGAPDLPFGGVKASGVGRELGRFGVDEFANKKLVRRLS